LLIWSVSFCNRRNENYQTSGNICSQSSAFFHWAYSFSIFRWEYVMVISVKLIGILATCLFLSIFLAWKDQGLNMFEKTGETGISLQDRTCKILSKLIKKSFFWLCQKSIKLALKIDFSNPNLMFLTVWIWKLMIWIFFLSRFISRK
jgi:hypothetical protein